MNDDEAKNLKFCYEEAVKAELKAKDEANLLRAALEKANMINRSLHEEIKVLRNEK